MIWGLNSINNHKVYVYPDPWVVASRIYQSCFIMFCFLRSSGKNNGDSADVLNDIGNMLQDLTDELDAMLEFDL